MNILFSVPRIHTNYSGMITGLIKEGHRISFITMTEEDKNYQPDESNLPVYIFTPKKRFFIPEKRLKQLHYENFSKIREVFDKENPDLIISRDLKLLNIQIGLTAKLNKIPILYYDQSPPDYQKESKNFIWDTIPQILISKYRITTVKNNLPGDDSNGDHSFFIPFPVCETNIRQSYSKTISQQNPLKIIVVAKLDEKRKNLLFFLESLLPFFKHHLIHVSIYGRLRNKSKHQDYYNSICDLIEKYSLSNSVNIYPNHAYSKVLKEYANNDLFILPSLNEPAAISLFEAMSSGIPVIVTNQNGTNYPVNNGVNGFTYNPLSKKELQDSINFFIEKPERLKEFGQRSLKIINSHYRPIHFVKNLQSIFKTAFKQNLQV